jgi:hypothetical protein
MITLEMGAMRFSLGALLKMVDPSFLKSFPWTFSITLPSGDLSISDLSIKTTHEAKALLISIQHVSKDMSFGEPRMTSRSLCELRIQTAAPIS